MALSYREVIDRGIDRTLFITQMEEKAPRRKPKRVGVKSHAGTMFAMRNKRLTIREAALRLVQCILTYTKTTTGETRIYVVAPYEMKYRRLRAGLRKVLYAYDMEDKHIKSFVLDAIRRVALTDRHFVPRWPVLIR